MKPANIFKLTVIVLISFVGVSTFLPSTNIFATDLDSSNYKIVGATTSGGGGIQNSTNFNMISTAGEISADPRNYSTNYQLHQDPSANFVAAVPGIQCFETDTDGTTNCTSGPDELLTGGMVAICGGDGCYDKARFEIEGVSRPPTSNTLSFYGLDESSGSGAYLLDTSGNDYHGTPTGTTYTTDGVINGARDFNGSSDYVSIGTLGNLGSSLATTPVTISFWINTTYTSGIRQFGTINDGVNTILVINFNRTSSDAYQANLIGIDVRKNGGGNLRGIASVTDMYDGNWHHVSLSADVANKTIEIYLDGQSQTVIYGSQSTMTSFSNFQYPFTFGASNNRGTVGNYLDCQLDELRISTGMSTEEEILQEYEYGTKERSNPEDTLYMVQISEDNFASDIKCIDGSTFRPKTLSSCDINDFRTEAQWEAEDFNVQGLAPSTQYYIRATALHGDFTQSDYSTSSNATTTAGSITFDIDIATSTGITTESSPPYSVAFTGAYELIGGSSAITAPNLVWLDIDSNSAGGVAILQHGENGGLYSPTTTQTITSATANLDETNDGFGLQSYYIDSDDSSPYYGALTATSAYSGSLNNIGVIDTNNSKIYDGDGPIVSGRTGIKILAKPGNDKTAATDYTENIYFVLVPRY